MPQPPIGFALVTFRDPENTYRLLDTLNRVFGDPPISIHHDYRKSALDLGRFGRNVRLLDRSRNTGWGTLETTLAMADSMTHLMSREDAPRWFHLVTGHCYPIMGADASRDFLDSSGFDLFMEEDPFYPGFPDEPRLEEWSERYVYRLLRFPFPNRRGKIGMRTQVVRSLGKGCPFTAHFPCRAGATYFTGNTAAGEALIAGLANKDLVDWYRHRPIVDESLFQTILGNAPGLRKSRDNLRFILWPDLTLHPEEEKPKTLTMADLPELQASSGHIARKFMPGRSDELISWIDRERLGLVKPVTKTG